MEEQLFQLLTESPELNSLVGNRIRPVERSQIDRLPAVTVQRIDGIRDYNMKGASGLVFSRVQIDCWAFTYSEAKATARVVSKLLSGIRAPFQASLLVDENDTSEEADSKRVFRTRLDFRIFHREVTQET